MTARAIDLRDVFDRGFADPPPPPEPAHSDFLCIEVAGEPLAIRLAEIASLHADLRIVALPTRAPELLGVAAIRVSIVPIYDLGIALGAASKASARWTVLLRGGTVGFAFAGYDGHARIADRAIALPAGRAAAAAPRGYVRGQFTRDGQPRSVIELAAVRTAIELRSHPRSAAKDH